MSDCIVQARDLMMRFLERGKRYLWTDAFAVCNLLALGRHDLARDLVDSVYRTLGVAKGLRIGKPLPEREPDEPYDDRLEWDRDGQYFHYLTKWMHALDAVGEHARAVELAVVAHDGFVYEARGKKRMYWKMSIDLSRPLVPSMGHHDPLDGYLTAMQLRDVPRRVTDDYAAMIDRRGLATTDPLGLGGLLADASRLERVADDDASLQLLDAMLAAALAGLRAYVERTNLRAPATRRLAFRELGLAIGLGALDPMPRRDVLRRAEPARLLAQLSRFMPLREEIEAFWEDPANRAVASWRAHEDINDVMLATSLLPGAFA